ncbi:enoyl-CoA hydratase [Geomicrobium sp. JCM 19037]|uniref:enoyl-CoA hydratase/isomerase family protein n=1 Tax=Geomicrobium sp. JCM 19037 TaxID=1460634 RepID=UPI00045F4493|nr:enoyl-CoA hydratase/isomerase family protein [Geomicrobium sp. JCM 19037]GAK05153.1 enoyl-CoA hydratase [Geomicrobium sp. JCM 19037]
MKYIELLRDEGVVEILLNRPPVNALNKELIEELREAFHDVEACSQDRVVIIRSLTRAFVAGADIKMMETFHQLQQVREMVHYVKDLQQLYDQLEAMSKPTIAYIEGHALGGGLELAMSCDFRVMNRQVAKVGLPEVKLGLIPGAGGTQRLTRLIGETKAKELIYFSKQWNADEAYQHGLVSSVVNGREDVLEIASQLANQSLSAIVSVKRCIQTASEQTHSLGSERELTETLNAFSSEDARIGMELF